MISPAHPSKAQQLPRNHSKAFMLCVVDLILFNTCLNVVEFRTVCGGYIAYTRLPVSAKNSYKAINLCMICRILGLFYLIVFYKFNVIILNILVE